MSYNLERLLQAQSTQLTEGARHSWLGEQGRKLALLARSDQLQLAAILVLAGTS